MVRLKVTFLDANMTEILSFREGKTVEDLLVEYNVSPDKVTVYDKYGIDCLPVDELEDGGIYVVVNNKPANENKNTEDD